MLMYFNLTSYICKQSVIIFIECASDNWPSSGGKITTSILFADDDVAAAVAFESCTYLDAYWVCDLPPNLLILFSFIIFGLQLAEKAEENV